MVRRLLRNIAAPVLVSALLVLGVMLATGALVVPPRHNPFAPLDIAEAPGLWTGWKFARARGDADLCRQALARADIAFDVVPNRVSAEGCGLTDAGRIRRLGAVQLSSAVTVTCPVALGLAMFARHGLEPAARSFAGPAPLTVTHLGTYACRNINNETARRRSEHATANAIDITGFVLANGRRLTLARDWSGADAQAAGFLRAVRGAACRWFAVTLSPDYNALHRDHFHLDMGRGRSCR